MAQWVTQNMSPMSDSSPPSKPAETITSQSSISIDQQPGGMLDFTPDFAAPVSQTSSAQAARVSVSVQAAYHDSPPSTSASLHVSGFISSSTATQPAERVSATMSKIPQCQVITDA